MRKLILALVLAMSTSAHAQFNNRGWINIVQNMVGNQSSITSTPVNAYNSVQPMKYYSLSVVGPSGQPAWDVRLEGSNDGNYWSTLVLNSNITHSAGGPVFQPNASPALYLRVRAVSLTANGSVTATAIAVP